MTNIEGRVRESADGLRKRPAPDPAAKVKAVAETLTKGSDDGSKSGSK